MSLDTTNWASYPFTVKGVNFVSKIDKNGSFYPQISRLPVDMVNTMNTQAVLEIIGDISLLSADELSEELDRVNEGATQALICLA
ncbi:MAG: hypothetical protein EBX97_07825 [Actinobacteria bacterium]|nr:hypothetical protein [Actinomycetota bacterium]